MTNVITFSELSQRIINLPSKHHQRLIAIDGGGGSGKTTFATRLQKEIAGSFIVKIDDFYRPPQLRSPLVSTQVINPNFDWDRFRKLVLEPVKNNQDICYQLYNFDKGTLSGEIISVPKSSTVIVEGVWCMQTAFVDFYDYRIWLEAQATIRLQRGVLRDGEDMRQAWEQEWIPIDEYYQETQKPQLQANCIVDSGSSDFQNDKIVFLD
jgi:uridine kinase